MDAFAEVLIVLLLLINVVQGYYWTKEIQKLIDKHMSKNYAEYVASKEYRAVLPRPTLLDAQEEHVHEEEILSELNQMLKQ